MKKTISKVLISFLALSITIIIVCKKEETNVNSEKQATQEKTESISAEKTNSEKKTEAVQPKLTEKAETATKSESAEPTTPKAVVSDFMNKINAGQYDESLTLFNEDILKINKISIEDFKSHVDSSLTKKRTMSKLEFTSQKSESDHVRLDFVIHYKDGSSKSKWVLVKADSDKVFLTTRGSMF